MGYILYFGAFPMRTVHAENSSKPARPQPFGKRICHPNEGQANGWMPSHFRHGQAGDRGAISVAGVKPPPPYIIFIPEIEFSPDGF